MSRRTRGGNGRNARGTDGGDGDVAPQGVSGFVAACLLSLAAVGAHQAGDTTIEASASLLIDATGDTQAGTTTTAAAGNESLGAAVDMSVGDVTIEASDGFDPASLNLAHRLIADTQTAGSLSTWTAAVGPNEVAGTAPTVVANAYNGKKCVRYVAASSQYLAETAAAYLASGTAFTFVSVYRAEYASSCVWYQRGDQICQQSYQGYPQLTLQGVSQYSHCDNLADLGLTRIIWRFNGAATGDANRLKLRANGVDQVLTFVGSVPSALSLPAGSAVGAGFGNAVFADGDFLEAYITTDTESDATTALIDRDLVARHCPKVVFVASDSNGRGYGTSGWDSGRGTSWPNGLSETAGVRSGGTDVRAYAVSGWRIDQLETDAPTTIWPYATAYTQKTFIIAAGANDVAQGATGAQTLTRLDSLVAAATAQGFTHVYVTTILPNQIASIAVDPAVFEAERLSFNAGLPSRVGVSITAVIDCAADPRLDDCLDLAYYQADKGHLNDAGQAVMADLVHTGIAARLLPRGIMTIQTTVLEALRWGQTHPAECWLAFSAGLNIAFRVRTPEKWVTWCERYPVAAAAVRVVRALGFDPAGALKALAMLASAKAAGSTLGGLLGSDAAPPTPRDPSAARPPLDSLDDTRRP